jgi:hypothetical protein
VIADQFPRLEAGLSPEDGVGRARIHFRPEGGANWYSVPLKKEGASFAGVLPKPRKQLAAFDYYIEVTDAGLGTTRTREFRTAVESGPTACKDKVVAGGLASATGVAVQAPAGATGLPVVPVGFSPDGVVATAGATTSGAGGGTGGGISGAKLGLIVGGAAVAVGGVALAAGGGSSSGGSDGGSSPPGGGNPPACTAAPITSSLANAPTTLRCGQPVTVGVVVTNGSCSTLAIQSVVLNHQSPVTPNCQGANAQFTYVPSLASLPAGQTGTVLNFRSDPLCCVGGPCVTTFTCSFNEIFSVQTGAGPVPSGTVAVQVSYDPSCPVCP